MPARLRRRALLPLLLAVTSAALTVTAQAGGVTRAECSFAANLSVHCLFIGEAL